MQVMGLLNQLSTGGTAGSVRRTGSNYQNRSTFSQALQQKQIHQVKQEIYDKFQISVGAWGKAFSCYIPSNLLYKMSGNAGLKEKVYKQLESYSPENYQASIAGLDPPVKKCTLVFDEGGNAFATLEAASSEQDLLSSPTGSLYKNYLLQQASLFPDPSGLYGSAGVTGSFWSNGYGLNSLYGSGCSYPASSLYGAASLYKNGSLFSSVMGKLSQLV